MAIKFLYDPAQLLRFEQLRGSLLTAIPTQRDYIARQIEPCLDDWNYSVEQLLLELASTREIAQRIQIVAHTRLSGLERRQVRVVARNDEERCPAPACAIE